MIEDGAAAWDGTLLLKQMTYKVNIINQKMVEEILDGVHEQINDSNKHMVPKRSPQKASQLAQVNYPPP